MGRGMAQEKRSGKCVGGGKKRHVKQDERESDHTQITPHANKIIMWSVERVWHSSRCQLTAPTACSAAPTLPTRPPWWRVRTPTLFALAPTLPEDADEEQDGTCDHADDQRVAVGEGREGGLAVGADADEGGADKEGECVAAAHAAAARLAGAGGHG